MTVLCKMRNPPFSGGVLGGGYLIQNASLLFSIHFTKPSQIVQICIGVSGILSSFQPRLIMFFSVVCNVIIILYSSILNFSSSSKIFFERIIICFDNTTYLFTGFIIFVCSITIYSSKHCWNKIISTIFTCFDKSI